VSTELKPLLAKLEEPRERLQTLRELEQCLRTEKSLTAFLTLAGALGELDLSDVPAKPLRLFILRSTTLEQVVPVLQAKAFLLGIRLQTAMGGFNQYQQEVLDPSSALYSHAPQVIILAVRLADLAPELVSDYAVLTRDQAAAAADGVLQIMGDLVRTLRSRTKATILVQNFEVPAFAAYGVFDAQQPGGQGDVIRDLNRSLAGLCRETAGTYVVDYEGLTGRVGKLAWVDPRLQMVAGISVNPQLLPALADEYLRFLIPVAGLTRKCLVLDMDNTLWGGIIGEDGMGGVALGADYPGNAYVAFQRVVLNLYRRGVILALCSKNNLADALEVLETHPHSVLRKEHFAAMRINWVDKASNIRGLARELNIGLDSLVFLDDNPAEIAQVTQDVPEVLTYQLPREEPERYAGFLESLPVFEMLSLTDEDRRRGEEYRQQSLRRELEENCTSLDEYYARLQMRARVSPATDELIPRIAQLTQKTNQFNLTTRRYTEQEVRANIASGAWHVYALELDDRFGKNGWVAVGILHPAEGGEEVFIDTLLMSCRVMSRTVEGTFVSLLASEARRLGFARLVGEYIPTAKNGVVAGMYQSLGFEPGAREGLWVLDLAVRQVEPSPHIEVTWALPATM
jgi:FkbH-like protein